VFCRFRSARFELFEANDCRGELASKPRSRCAAALLPTPTCCSAQLMFRDVFSTHTGARREHKRPCYCCFPEESQLHSMAAYGRSLCAPECACVCGTHSAMLLHGGHLYNRLGESEQESARERERALFCNTTFFPFKCCPALILLQTLFGSSFMARKSRWGLKGLTAS